MISWWRVENFCLPFCIYSTLMEQRSWSLMATAINRKRHISLDMEDLNKGCKRVCVEPFRDPMGLVSSLSFENSWEAKPNIMNPHFQSTKTASELISGLKAQSPTLFMAEPFTHDSAHPVSDHGQVFRPSHSEMGCALRSTASLPIVVPDTGFITQTPGPEPSAPAVLSESTQL